MIRKSICAYPRATPIERYTFASRLTEKGLGFPQYCNDDIVVKGLVDKGYSLSDAVNYAVAACWEFIIPYKGMDIPNIDALSFLHCVDAVVRNCRSEKFTDFIAAVHNEIEKTTLALCQKHKNILYETVFHLCRYSCLDA